MDFLGLYQVAFFRTSHVLIHMPGPFGVVFQGMDVEIYEKKTFYIHIYQHHLRGANMTRVVKKGTPAAIHLAPRSGVPGICIWMYKEYVFLCEHINIYMLGPAQTLLQSGYWRLIMWFFLKNSDVCFPTIAGFWQATLYVYRLYIYICDMNPISGVNFPWWNQHRVSQNSWGLGRLKNSR